MNDKYKSDEQFYSYGAKLIELGEAMQDKRTGLRELVILGRACGFNLHMEFVPNAKAEE